jgi:hypothetical protein
MAKGEEISAQDEDKQKGVKLLLDEERETGQVAWMTYIHLLRAIGAWWMVVVVFLIMVWVESSRVLTIMALGFWTRDQFEGMSLGAYMGLYAGTLRSTPRS